MLVFCVLVLLHLCVVLRSGSTLTLTSLLAFLNLFVILLNVLLNMIVDLAHMLLLVLVKLIKASLLLVELVLRLQLRLESALVQVVVSFQLVYQVLLILSLDTELVESLMNHGRVLASVRVMVWRLNTEQLFVDHLLVVLGVLVVGGVL